MARSKLSKFIIAVIITGLIAFLVLVVLRKDPDPAPVTPENIGADTGECDTFPSCGDIPFVAPKPEIVKSTPKVEPKEKTPSAPAPTLQNNQEAPAPNNPQPTPVIVNNNITVPSTTVIVQPSPAPEPETPMASTAPTYTIKKDGETIKSKVLIEEVRTFVASLNTYVSWKKKSQIATIEELTEMLTSNGYDIK